MTVGPVARHSVPKMAGDGPTVIAAAEKLSGLIPDEVARGIALVQPVKAAPYFAHALFSPSATVLALPDPGDAIPYVKAMWHYARGIAYAAQGEFTAAKAEANAIAALEGGDFTLLKSSGVPAQDVLALARTVIEARVAQRQGDKAAAIERFERAAALQDGLPYMEPPYWYYPGGSRRVALTASTPRSRVAVSASSSAPPAPDNRRTGLPNSIRRAARPTRRASWKRILPRRGGSTRQQLSCRVADPRVVPPGGGKLTARGPHGRGQCARLKVPPTTARRVGRTSASAKCRHWSGSPLVKLRNSDIRRVTGHGRLFAGDAWARPCVFRGPPPGTPGQSKGRSASRAGRPIVVPFGFCGTTVFRVIQEVTVAEGFFGERGGTRTLDPMIKSHVLYRLSYALTRRAV